MTKVKICGIKNREIAQAAADLGADFIGLNFVPNSKRKIDVQTAQEVADSVREKVKIVGVFQNQRIAEILEIVQKVSLDMVQLHGDEDDDFMKKITVPIIKKIPYSSSSSIRVQGQFESRSSAVLADYYILDREVQGTGKMVDITTAKKLAQSFQLFFAGGLKPENVSHVVQSVRPFAVDVSSGVETRGEKDIEKIKRFIKNAKLAHYA